jgi:hypothetical protein
MRISQQSISVQESKTPQAKLSSKPPCSSCPSSLGHTSPQPNVLIKCTFLFKPNVPCNLLHFVLHLQYFVIHNYHRFPVTMCVFCVLVKVVLDLGFHLLLITWVRMNYYHQQKPRDCKGNIRQIEGNGRRNYDELGLQFNLPHYITLFQVCFKFLIT